MSAGTRVLLIEDNPGDVRLVREMLRSPGEPRFELEIAELLADGLRRASDGGFDVLLLDLNLPDSQGLETFLRIQASAPQIPAVVLTGSDDVDLAIRAVQAGAQDYLVKGQVDGVLLPRSIRYAIERKRAEFALRESEEKSRSITASAHDAILIMDGDGRIAHWNPAAERMLGYTEKEALGRDLHTFIVPERFRERFHEAFPRFRSTGEGPMIGRTVELAAIRKGGDELPIELSLSGVKRGATWQAIGIVRDITERKRAGEELRASEASYRRLNESMRDGFARVDMAGNLVEWNTAYQAMLGYSADELRSMNYRQLTPERWHALEARVVAEGVLSRGYSDIYEKEYRRKDGSVFPVELRTFLLRNESGDPESMWAIIRDITERKRAEEQQARIGKLEALGTLAGGVAHDFNNILLVINGNAALAGSELPPEHPAQSCLAEILKAGHRATDLVRRILTFSRPQDQRREVLPLGPVVEEALKLVRATVPAMIEIQADLANELSSVSIDSSQVQQLIVNLATNATYAIGESRGRIEVRLDEMTVSDGASISATGLREGRYVRLSVSDDGCGMDRATLDRIFDPFFTTKPAGVGTGLGLSVVHGIMKGHEGAVTADSDPGKGSLFRLYFPAMEKAAGAPAQRGSQVEKGHGERVLFVDDEDALVYLVPRLLRKLGYRVTAHGSAELALEDFRSRPWEFELVVTDLSMPRMSGLDLARELLATRPDIPIVLTSGYVRPELEETALRIGIRGVILKPDTVEEMGHLLQDLLRNHRGNQQVGTVLG